MGLVELAVVVLLWAAWLVALLRLLHRTADRPVPRHRAAINR